MGKRRIRNLQALGMNNILGFDKRQDRCKEATEKYKIVTHTDFNELIQSYRIDVFIISLPPDLHHVYMAKAVEMEVSAFIEASVVDADLREIAKQAAAKNVFLAPSCTLYFHPAIKKIISLIKSNELGAISNFIYHSGQYLPDWHTYENVSDYYVSNKLTGGAREIVPFELTWITLAFGYPKRVTGFYKKTIEIEGAPDIDDTYNLLLDYEGSIFNLSIDVVSRYATRRLLVNGQNKQLYWDWNDNVIKIYDPMNAEWQEISYQMLSAETGYNKNITEQMYVDEMKAFLNALNDHKKYPNTLENDITVLNILYATEKSDKSNLTQTF